MVNKQTLIAVGITLGVLTAISSVRALRPVKRIVLG
ncbi:hypothetical protein AN213_00440 [Pseudoalteromonas sp. P1-8]|nr:hypothetical protein AN213_00440 [Pseudoalteromonas sp. P1-8]